MLEATLYTNVLTRPIEINTVFTFYSSIHVIWSRMLLSEIHKRGCSIMLPQQTSIYCHSVELLELFGLLTNIC